MLKRLPLIPTLLVLIAVGVMVRLGLWQLDRLHQKEALLALYAAADKAPERPLEGWTGEHVPETLLYHRVWTDCAKVTAIAPRAGHNAAGETGWAQVADCTLQQGDRLNVVLGWTSTPAPVQWQGGLVHGTLSGGGALVADPPLAGLQANARPDPNDLPNNHLSYAFQWFAFALTALVIYALALRKRLGAE